MATFKLRETQKMGREKMCGIDDEELIGYI
jgi:hypothetical protein